MEINQATNWRVEDPDPGRPLENIHPTGVRALALLARRMSHPAVRDNFLKISGAVDMLGGLDYHFDNLQRIETSLSDYLGQVRMKCGSPVRLMTRAETISVQHGRYEALAYMVTLGRWHYFARALGPSVAGINTPTIDRLLVFRHKIGAHRSVDMPTGESPDLQSLHAFSLSAAGGQLFKPIPGGALGLHYQIQREVGVVEDFVPSEDHVGIMEESYAVLSQLLS